MLVLILIQVKIICNVHGICSCETAEFTEREMIPPLEPPILESAFLENGEIFIPNHMSRKAWVTGSTWTGFNHWMVESELAWPSWSSTIMTLLKFLSEHIYIFGTRLYSQCLAQSYYWLVNICLINEYIITMLTYLHTFRIKYLQRARCCTEECYTSFSLHKQWTKCTLLPYFIVEKTEALGGHRNCQVTHSIHHGINNFILNNCADKLKIGFP